MFNIHKIAEDIFKAPSQDDLKQRMLDPLQKNPDGSYSSDTEIVIPSFLVKNGKLTVKFKKCSQDFICEGRGLTTLEGCPEWVGGDFVCQGNELITLKGSPKIVDGNFMCSNNGLTTLKSDTEFVGRGFYCNSNYIDDLKGMPKFIGGDFKMTNNPSWFMEEEIRANSEIKGNIIQSAFYRGRV